jgi:FtsZ-binding cell division protein ZapB
MEKLQEEKNFLPEEIQNFRKKSENFRKKIQNFRKKKFFFLTNYQNVFPNW